MRALGIDIGGSGIKGAIVDTKSGKLLSPRYRIATPRPATPKAVAQGLASVVKHFKWKGPVGCGMPGPIIKGRVIHANNLHPSWDNYPAEALFRKQTGRSVSVINDADAAGLAEREFGAGKRRGGLVVMLTLGTGIGSALFMDGRLVPNTEFGQLEIRGKIAEKRAAASIRKKLDLTWSRWGSRLQEYLTALEILIAPEVIILGGGVSRRWKKFSPYLKTRALILPARLHNEAGIVGAALAATTRRTRRT
jgi:polyphosphate glucokinase